MPRLRLSALAGILVTLSAWAALTLTHHDLRDPIPPQRAIAIARHDPLVQRALRNAPGRLDVATTPVDTRIERVLFTSGGRAIAEVAVYRNGQVGPGISYRDLPVPYGSRLAYQPWLLAVLSLVFVLSTAVAPLRRLRNVDVLALLTLLAPMVLLKLRYVELSVAAAAPGLLYLLGRCSQIAFSPARAPAPQQRPLFDLITARWDPGRRVRSLRMTLVALGLIFVMVCVSSTQAVDVLYALMEGATRIVHGMLPYGHMPGDVVHGDTYPLLSYLLYVPLATLSPVHDNWDSVDLGLALSAVCAIAAAGMLAGRAAFSRLRAPGRRGSARSESCTTPAGASAALRAQSSTASLRAAVAWLSFPPLLAIASTGTSDVVLAAMLLAVVLVWRRPRAAAGLLAAATWFKLAPAVLVPPFLASLRLRRWPGALAAMAAVTALPVAVLLALGGMEGVRAMIDAVGWQFHRGSPQSLWAVLGVGGLQPLGQAAVLGLLAAASITVRRDRAFSEQPVRIAALAAALLIALQLSADYWAFLYLAWILPLLGMALLGRSAATRPVPETAKSRLRLPAGAFTTGEVRNLGTPVAPVPVGTST